MLKRIRVVSEAYEVVRPVCLSVVAMSVAACAMALVGWKLPGFVVAVLLAAIAGTLVCLVRRSVTHLNAQSQLARRTAAEAERHYVEVLRRIIAFVEARDKHWRGHSRNVGDLARRIAREMRLPTEACSLLEVAGQLHDIGLLAVPAEVLAQSARYGAEQYRSMQKHSEISHEVLRPLEMLGEVLPAIRAHHERMNGTGYPDGLAGQAIPLGGRILAVADAYDAMTHDRPHRPAITALAAMRELGRCCPSGFDPEVVKALGRLLNAPVLEETLVGRRVEAPAFAELAALDATVGRDGAWTCEPQE